MYKQFFLLQIFFQNYGDESGTYGLMYPSIYSNHGVYEEDFFKPQPAEKIQEIFEQIGVTMPTEVFEELWERAKERSPNGEVKLLLFLVAKQWLSCYAQEIATLYIETALYNQQTPIITYITLGNYCSCHNRG